MSKKKCPACGSTDTVKIIYGMPTYEAFEAACWKDKYYDNDVCDGTQWDIVIKLPNHKEIKKCGSNEYPPYWNKFIKIMKKYVDENIE